MKNNTSEVRSYVEAALRSLPGDFALGEVRALLAATLNRIEHVEQKRSRRNANEAANQPFDHRARYDMMAKEGFVAAPKYNMTATQCRQAVLGLDRMIREEQKKLGKPENHGRDEETPKDLPTILG